MSISVIAKSRKLKPAKGYYQFLVNPVSFIETNPDLKHVSADAWTHLAGLVEKKGTQKKFSIKDMFSVQRFVEDVLLDPDPKHIPKEPILVVVANGFPVILDGNHRIALAWLSGEDFIKATSLEINKFVPPKVHKQILNLNRKLISLR